MRTLEANLKNTNFILVGFSSEALRPDAMRQDPTRKGSVVNVNPTNTRPQSDTPEIRKYKKRFNSEILCAALWGEFFYHHMIFKRAALCKTIYFG